MRDVLQRLVQLRLTQGERVVGATALAGTIIFVGILIDMPTVERAKMLKAERQTLSADVAALTVQLDALRAEQRELETEVVRTAASPPDPLVSSFMRELTRIEDHPEVRFGSIKPAVAALNGTAVEIEVSAPLRVLGPYIDDLERSRWAIRIRDFQLARNPEPGPAVVARFIAETEVRVRGLEPTPPGEEHP